MHWPAEAPLSGGRVGESCEIPQRDRRIKVGDLEENILDANHQGNDRKAYENGGVERAVMYSVSVALLRAPTSLLRGVWYGA